MARQSVHPLCARRELLAEALNPLWSWDIASLKTTVKLTYVHLYVVLDVFSRYSDRGSQPTTDRAETKCDSWPCA